MKRKLLMILALLTVSAITVPLSTIENGISNDTVSKPKISQSNENQEKTISEEEKETDDQLEITESPSNDVKKISDEGDEPPVSEEVHYDYDIGNCGRLYDSETEAYQAAEAAFNDFSDPDRYVSSYVVYSTYDKWTISYYYSYY